MTTRRIGVVGGNSMWRRGVRSVLDDAGYTAVELEDLAAWTPGRGGVAVVAQVETGEDLTPIEAFNAQYEHIPVLAVCPVLGITEFAAVIRAGATAALAVDDTEEDLLGALEHALRGRSSAPHPIVHGLSLRVAAGFGEMPRLDDSEMAWLRALASGTTVAQLAEDAGYSEREMFRNLSELYARIGAGNRTEAILWASRYGLLDPAAG